MEQGTLQPPIPPEMEAELAKARAKEVCRAHILAYYPLHRQLNILMGGDQDEINRMQAFISACRAWRRVENPEVFDLVKITP